MELSSLTNAASNAASAQTQATAANFALRKALDVQQQGALTLLEALPKPTYSSPSNLGNSIDTKA